MEQGAYAGMGDGDEEVAELRFVRGGDDDDKDDKKSKKKGKKGKGGEYVVDCWQDYLIWGFIPPLFGPVTCKDGITAKKMPAMFPMAGGKTLKVAWL